MISAGNFYTTTGWLVIQGRDGRHGFRRRSLLCLVTLHKSIGTRDQCGIKTRDQAQSLSVSADLVYSGSVKLDARGQDC